MTTETIDRLFLELSQFTQAKTAREIALECELKSIRDQLQQIGMKDRNGKRFRPIVMRVMNCKNGKPPQYDPSHVPNMLRVIGDDELTSTEDCPWFVIGFMPTEVFGEGE